MSLKNLVLTTLSVPGATLPFGSLLRDRATILMLHRFRVPEQGIDGIEPAVVEQGLAYLRRSGYELLGLEELFHRLAGEGASLRRAVAITIDDGYIEQATIGAPIFARYDCPVTNFVSTGFLDGLLWFWWDQIEYVFEHASRREVSARLGHGVLSYTWTDDGGRRRMQQKCVQWCMRQPEAVKNTVIAELARSAEVEIPREPPPRYRPMSWDLARSCETQGMRFGPHTVTHPILSRTSDEQSQREITESWRRLQSEVSSAVPVFCYPNGCIGDFGLREIGALQDLGFLGAVTATQQYASADVLQNGTVERFRVPRYAFPYDHPHFIQVVSGVERFKQVIRRAPPVLSSGLQEPA